MRSNVTNRIQFDHIVAGVLRTINNPSYYKQFGKLIHVDLIYPSDTSERVQALKEVLRVAAALANESKTDIFSLNYIINEIPLKTQDELKGGKVVEFINYWKNSDSIKLLMEDEGVFDSFVSYIKALQIFQIADKFSKDLNENRVDSAVELMQKALHNISTISNMDKEELKESEALEYINESSKPTYKGQVLLLGCPPIDSVLGGFERQTLNGFISKTNGGKTMMAHHLISQCVKNGIHCWVGAVEDRKKSFIYKIMSNLSGISMRRLKEQFNNLSPTEMESLKKANRLIDQYVHVDFLYGFGIDAVHKASLDYDLHCKINGRPVPSVNIVDYSGHIAGRSYGDKMYEKMRSAYGARKDFILKYDKIGFDFAQINREGSKNMSNNHIVTQNDLAGAYDLSQVFDNLISLNRNDEDVINGYSKLHVCKARDAAVGATIQVKVAFHKAAYEMKSWSLVSGNTEMIDICKGLTDEQQKENDKNGSGVVAITNKKV